MKLQVSVHESRKLVYSASSRWGPNENEIENYRRTNYSRTFQYVFGSMNI